MVVLLSCVVVNGHVLLEVSFINCCWLLVLALMCVALVVAGVGLCCCCLCVAGCCCCMMLVSFVDVVCCCWSLLFVV